jgi:hypothetical protein
MLRSNDRLLILHPEYLSTRKGHALVLLLIACKVCREDKWIINTNIRHESIELATLPPWARRNFGQIYESPFNTNGMTFREAQA